MEIANYYIPLQSQTLKKRVMSLDVRDYIARQLQKDDLTFAAMIDVERTKVNYLKQYNNAERNIIDRERVKVQKAALINKVME